MLEKGSIALIGFMATGKTSVGKALAEYLGEEYRFIETDQMIIEEAGKSIPQIFKEDGEIKFRKYEIVVCEKASKLKKVIISCGGGVVLNEINIKNLKKTCHIVLLKASKEELYKRAIKDGKETRPVINKENPMKEIEVILNFREPYYEASAEFIIETTGKPIEKIVNEIIEKTKIK